MKRKGRGRLLLWLGLLVAVVAAIVWSFSRLDWHLVRLQLASASWISVTAMAGVWLVALCIRPLRLQFLLAALGPEGRRNYWTVWSADIIAMAMNSVIPARAGDIMLAFVLRERPGDPTASVFSIVMVDRLFDLATVMVFFVVSLSWAPGLEVWASDLRGTVLVILLAIVVGGWMAVHLRRGLLIRLDRLLERAPPERRVRWQKRARDLSAGLEVVDKPSVMLRTIFLSFVLWGTTAVAYWLGITAIWPAASVAGAAFAASVVALSFVVPLTPGGVGVFHAAAVLSLSLFGVPAEPALAFAIIFHVVQLGSVLSLGLVALVRQGISFRTLAAVQNSRS